MKYCREYAVPTVVQMGLLKKKYVAIFQIKIFYIYLYMYVTL